MSYKADFQNGWPSLALLACLFKNPEKVAQKVGPGNLVNGCLNVFFAGSSPNHLDKTPNGICVWSRCRCHSVVCPKFSDIRQTKSIRIVAFDLGSPLRGQKLPWWKKFVAPLTLIPFENHREGATNFFSITVTNNFVVWDNWYWEHYAEDGSSRTQCNDDISCTLVQY